MNKLTLAVVPAITTLALTQDGIQAAIMGLITVVALYIVKALKIS